jgi:hypothetical protein
MSGYRRPYYSKPFTTPTPPLPPIHARRPSTACLPAANMIRHSGVYIDIDLTVVAKVRAGGRVLNYRNRERQHRGGDAS